MQAAVAPDMPSMEQPMTGPLTASMVFHIVLGLLVMFGLPFMKSKPVELADSISVELVKVDELTQTNKPPPSAPLRQPKVIDKPPEETPPKPAAPQVTAKTPPKPAAPKKPEAKETPVTPKEPEKAEVVQKPVSKPETKPEKAPVLTKPTESEQEEFQSLLRNLMPADPTAGAPTQSPDKTAEPSPLAKFGQQMSMSELDALKTQLSQCWKLMAGARYAEDLSVDIKLFLNSNRTIRDAQVVDQFRYSSDNYYRAAADSALRAVRNPHCNPLDLPPDKYDQWKIMTVTFDPREML